MPQLRVLCKPVVGARNKYQYERCIATASTHYVSFPVKLRVLTSTSLHVHVADQTSVERAKESYTSTERTSRDASWTRTREAKWFLQSPFV